MDRNIRNTFHAVIVLANLIDQKGNLNDESFTRMETAISAFKNKEAKFIVTTGWAYRSDSPIFIAEAMRKHALMQHGIPHENGFQGPRNPLSLRTLKTCYA